MLWLSIRSDPHNIDTYLIASYWFSSKKSMNQPDLAHKVLLEGQLHNPGSYRIQLERAMLFLREGNTIGAKRALKAGLSLWPGKQDPESNAAHLGKENLLTYRALLHEVDNEIPQAVKAWGEVLALYPDRTNIRARVGKLQRGEPPPVKASLLWKAFLKQSDSQQADCHRDDNAPAHKHEHKH